MRALVLTTFIGASALAESPCMLSGGADLPAGKLWAGSQVVALTAPFRFEHRVTIPLSAAQSDKRTITISNERAKISLALEPVEPIAAVARRRIAFGPFFPDSGSRLSVHGFDHLGLIVGIECPAELDCGTKTTKVASARCGDVALTLKGATALEKQPKGASVMIAQGEVPIAVEPNGIFTDTLLVSPDSLGTMLEVRGNRAHLWWGVSGGTIDGWVPLRSLSIMKATYGSGVGMLAGRRSGVITIIDSETVRCRDEVPLLVRVGGELAPLGTLKARAPFKRTVDDAISLEFDGLVWNAGVEVTIAWPRCVLEKAQ